MADNVTSPVPAGTKLATDEIGGIHFPRQKIVFGTDGTAADVSSSSPLPVSNPSYTPGQKTKAQSFPVASDTDLATSSKQDTGNNALASILSSVATAAKQDTMITSMSSAATKQDAGNSSLASLLASTGLTTAASGDSTVLGQLKLLNTAPTPAGTNNIGVVTLEARGTSGSAAPASGVMIGGTDGTNFRSLRSATDGTVFVTSGVASGTTDSGNPFKIGGYASSAVPTAVTSGQRVNAWYGLNGQGMVSVALFGGQPTSGGNPADGIGNGGVYGADVRAFGTYYDGALHQRVRGDASGAFIGSTVFYTESTTGLAASATFTGSLRSNGGTVGGVGTRFSFFVAEAFSDVSGGTLYIDKTVDGGTTYRQWGSIALSAGSTVTLKAPVTAAGYRARVVNGSNAQGAALVTSSFSLN